MQLHPKEFEGTVGLEGKPGRASLQEPAVYTWTIPLVGVLQGSLGFMRHSHRPLDRHSTIGSTDTECGNSQKCHLLDSGALSG